MKLFAWNTAAIFGFATNELALDGEWLKITPWGDFPNAVGLQRIERADGEAMVAAFNSVRGQVSRAFMGLPIFVGHPDMVPKEYPDKRRYGRVNELAAREDGLYGLVAFNSLGKQVLDDGQYQFASPAWLLRRDGKFVRPTQLVSVGLTNTPQIPGDPWAKNETDPQPMKKLTEALLAAGLIAADATEDAQLAAVNELITTRAAALTATNERSTLNSQLSTLNTALAAANEQFTAERTARIERELELGVTSGRITQAERAAWNEKFTADFAVTLTALNAAKAKLPTGSQVADLGKRKTEGAGEKLTAINAAVRAYAAEQKLDVATNEGWNAAYAGASKAKPELFSK